MKDHQHMARVFMREASSRHGNPSQREFVSEWCAGRGRGITVTLISAGRYEPAS